MSQSEKESALFMGLVMMFHTAAMQHMGKIKNPLTDKVERSLDQAQFAIDILDVLVSKTKGNLSDEENRFLANTVQELKLNYVDELSKKPEPGTPAPEDAGAKEDKKEQS
jgi:hypothetical protein